MKNVELQIQANIKNRYQQNENTSFTNKCSYSVQCIPLFLDTLLNFYAKMYGPNTFCIIIYSIYVQYIMYITFTQDNYMIWAFYLLFQLMQPNYKAVIDLKIP